MSLEDYYDSLPLGAYVTIPAADRSLKRLLESLGYNAERSKLSEHVMRRDTGRLRPILHLVASQPAAAIPIERKRANIG